MKQSKKKIVKFILKFAKNYLPTKIYSLLLFVRSFKKFKRYLNNSKTNIKFSKNLDKINQFEYKLTSQNNEDGIIDYIFKRIPNKKYFVEIGFDFYEFNTLNLIKNGWGGKLIEANRDESLALKKLLRYFFPKSKINVINKKIDRENINDIILSNLNGKMIDFFSIDTDGNDYWLLKNLNLEKINVICCEYNHWIGKNVKKTIPYNSNHQYKNDYYGGASLLAMHDLLESRGYNLIAVDSSGSNAFFVKKEFSNFFEVLSPLKSWRSSHRFSTEEQTEKISKEIKNFKFIDV